MAAVAHSHRLGVGGQGQLVAGAGVAEDVATVPAVVLQDGKMAVTDTQGKAMRTPSLLPNPEAHHLLGMGYVSVEW